MTASTSPSLTPLPTQRQTNKVPSTLRVTSQCLSSAPVTHSTSALQDPSQDHNNPNYNPWQHLLNRRTDSNAFSLNQMPLHSYANIRFLFYPTCVKKDQKFYNPFSHSAPPIPQPPFRAHFSTAQRCVNIHNISSRPPATARRVSERQLLSPCRMTQANRKRPRPRTNRAAKTAPRCPTGNRFFSCVIIVLIISQVVNNCAGACGSYSRLIASSTAAALHSQTIPFSQCLHVAEGSAPPPLLANAT